MNFSKDTFLEESDFAAPFESFNNDCFQDGIDEAFKSTFTWDFYHSEENIQKDGPNEFDLNYTRKEIIEDANINLENKQTRVTTFTGKKRERENNEDKDDKDGYDAVYFLKNEEGNKKEEIKIKKEKQKNKGRHKKNDIRNDENDENKHDKFSEDNLMRKIKTYIFNTILNVLNKSLKDRSQKFFKLEPKLNESMKKDLNEKLMNQKIKEIYINNEISKRYLTETNCNNNINLIKKIYEEKKEIDTIKILETEYIDYVTYLQKYEMGNFLRKIRNKEIKNPDLDVDRYINSLKSMFLNYAKWFNDKKGRKSKNNN
jgi:hypothetical protein